MKKAMIWISLFLIFTVALSACGNQPLNDLSGDQARGDPQGSGGGGPGQGGPGKGVGGQGGPQDNSQGGGQGRGVGMGAAMSGMHARHTAKIPKKYDGLRNPVAADEASLQRGAEIYTQNCASCHGDGGMGDGPAGATLDPVPSPVAHTSQMMGDDYLFWRISEGGLGAPFKSAMPAWKHVLQETDRWNVINYLRALGRGEVEPSASAGGMTFDPAREAAQRAEMLASAIEANLITRQEADDFDTVHAAIDAYMLEQVDGFSGRMEEMLNDILADIVANGAITQRQADTFLEVHDRLVEAGLMR